MPPFLDLTSFVDDDDLVALDSYLLQKGVLGQPQPVCRYYHPRLRASTDSTRPVLTFSLKRLLATSGCVCVCEGVWVCVWVCVCVLTD